MATREMCLQHFHTCCAQTDADSGNGCPLCAQGEDGVTRQPDLHQPDSVAPSTSSHPTDPATAEATALPGNDPGAEGCDNNVTPDNWLSEESDDEIASPVSTRKPSAKRPAGVPGRACHANGKPNASRRRKQGSRPKDQTLAAKLTAVHVSVNRLQKTVQQLEGKYTDMMDRMSNVPSHPDDVTRTHGPLTTAETQIINSVDTDLVKRLTQLEKRVKELERTSANTVDKVSVPTSTASSETTELALDSENAQQPANNNETPKCESVATAPSSLDLVDRDMDGTKENSITISETVPLENRFQALAEDVTATTEHRKTTTDAGNTHSDRGSSSGSASRANSSGPAKKTRSPATRTPNKTTESDNRRQDNKSTADKHQVDVMIVTSSIGKHIETRRMYSRKKVELVHLQQGKDITAAKAYIETTNVCAKAVTFVVSSNDLARAKSVSLCQTEMEHLTKLTRSRMGKDTHIAISQVLPRTGWVTYNRKAEDFNARMKKFCERHANMYFVRQNNLCGVENRQSDGVHLRRQAVGKLVVNIKTVLNPLLGMKPVSEYDHSRPTNRDPSRAAKPTPTHQRDQRDCSKSREHSTQPQPRDKHVSVGHHTGATNAKQNAFSSTTAGSYASAVHAGTDHYTEDPYSQPIPVLNNQNIRNAQLPTPAPTSGNTEFAAAINTVLSMKLSDLLRSWETDIIYG